MASQQLPTDRPVRAAVIGLGGAAQLIHLPIIEQFEELELVAVVDSDSYKVSKISDKYSVDGFIDIQNMLGRVEPDVVLICTPTITHLPLALTALAAGVHVIVEKPAVRNLQEALRLQQAAHESQRHVFVAMNQRFRQDVSVLGNFINNGEFGDIWRVRSGWLKRLGAWSRSSWLDQKKISGGGVMMDLGIQLLDVVLWMLQYPRPVRIVAYGHHKQLGRDVEDTLTSTIEFENGVLFHLDTSWALPSEKDIAYSYVEGNMATAQLNPLVIHRVVGGELVTMTPVKTAAPLQLYNASFEAQMHHFVNALRGQVAPISTVEEALEVMKLVDLIYTSVEKRREIVPSEA